MFGGATMPCGSGRSDRISVAGLTAGDVMRACAEQNLQVSRASLGAEPIKGGKRLPDVDQCPGRCAPPRNSATFVLKTGVSGEVVRLPHSRASISAPAT